MGDFNDNPIDKSIKPILNTIYKKTKIKKGELYNPMEELFKKYSDQALAAIRKIKDSQAKNNLENLVRFTTTTV
jgi:geranylgeranyl pyrophosphate synthase